MFCLLCLLLFYRDYKRNITSERRDADKSNNAELFINELHRFWDKNLTNIFRRDKDIRVADSVLHIFRIKQDIENFNKKALYILIREMTGSNTQHITRVINVMKKHYKDMMYDYTNLGEIDTTNTGSIFNA